MQLKKSLTTAVAAVALAGAAAGFAISGGEAASAATAGGTWAATAQPFPGFTAPDATLQAIACPLLGDCVAVGYTSGKAAAPIVASESNGVWGASRAITGKGGLASGSGASLTDVSCGGPGDCTAIGTYLGSLGVSTAFYVTETAGTWGTPVPVAGASQPAGTYSQVNGLSCPAVGYCAIVGRYTDQGVSNAGLTVSTAITLTEEKGTWGTPQPVPGLASLPSANAYANLNSVSCPAAGDCTASGQYGGDGIAGMPFVISQAGTGWGNAEALQGTPGASATSLSCPDASDCAVVMRYITPEYATQFYTVDEAAGTWGQGRLLSVPTAAENVADTPLIGCRSAGNCVIAGDMAGGVAYVPFAATETSSGEWGAGSALPGIDSGTEIAGVERLSCVPGGECTIAGAVQADTGGLIGIWAAVSSSDGSIGDVRQEYQAPGYNVAAGLSCPLDGYCTLAVLLDNKYMLAIEASPAVVALTPSARVVGYGAERSQKLAATVSSAAGGTPTGTVRITGPANHTLCVITLSGGAGTCRLSAGQLPAGADKLTAAYSGDVDYVAATGTTTVRVTPNYRHTRVTSFTVPATHEIHGNFKVSGTVQQMIGRKWQAAGSATVALYARPLPRGKWIFAALVKTRSSGAFSWTARIYRLGKLAWQARVARTTVGSTEFEPSDSATRNSLFADRTYVTHFVALHLNGDTALAAIIQDYPQSGGVHFVTVTGIAKFYYEPAGSTRWTYLGQARATKASQGSVALEPGGTLHGKFKIVFPAQGDFLGSSARQSLR
jgi:hypothetical protein